jgi:hypothetical protein
VPVGTSGRGKLALLHAETLREAMRAGLDERGAEAKSD